MSRVTAITFSKDRPAQLDLFLRSIDINCPEFLEPVVIWIASNPEFEKGYEIVLNKHYECKPIILKQTHFVQQTMDLVNVAPSECIGFFTDDSVIYKPIWITDSELAEFMELNSLYALSLRLGRNVTLQKHWPPYVYVTNVRKKAVKLGQHNGYIWNVLDADFGEDYGRPVSMDGNIHLAKYARNLVAQKSWTCVRTLDAIQPRHEETPFCLAFDESRLVNMPVNLSYGDNADNFAHFHRYTLEELNQKWLEGYEIDYNSFDFSLVDSAHKEFPFEFKKRLRGQRANSLIADEFSGQWPLEDDLDVSE